MPPFVDRSIIAFFFRGSLTRALFRWLNFEQFVHHGRKLSGPESAVAPESQVDWLEWWEAQDANAEAMPAQAILVSWVLLSTVFGAAAMVGVLSASHVVGVNLWVALLIFAALPMLLTVGSLVWSLAPVRGFSGHPFMALLFRKMALQSFRSATRLIVPWLQWQFQRGGIAFMLSALITFFLFATFQDVRFVWSSTFIDNSDTMHRMLSALAWPWHWWLDTPDISVVEYSRYRTGVTLAEPTADQTLWPFVVRCMFVYGLLPRLLVSLFYRLRLRQRLRRELLRSSLPDQFFTIQQHAISRSALFDQPDDETLRLIQRDPRQQLLVGWRLSADEPGVVWNLGQGKWADDEHWLKQVELQPARPVVVLTDLWQTPLGELSDCLGILQNRGAEVILMLTGSTQRSDRADAQERSWRYFAQKNRVQIVQENSQ